jgi:hypothetical protein
MATTTALVLVSLLASSTDGAVAADRTPQPRAAAALRADPPPPPPDPEPDPDCDWYGTVETTHRFDLYDDPDSDGFSAVHELQREQYSSADTSDDVCGGNLALFSSTHSVSTGPVNSCPEFTSYYTEDGEVSWSGTAQVNASGPHGDLLAGDIYVSDYPFVDVYRHEVREWDYVDCDGSSNPGTSSFDRWVNIGGQIMGPSEGSQGTCANLVLEQPTSQAFAGSCKQVIWEEGADSETVEYSWNLARSECNEAVDSDQGGVGDCAEFEAGTDPSDRSDDVPGDDIDNDGIDNDVDSCPDVYGDTVSGCPAPDAAFDAQWEGADGTDNLVQFDGGASTGVDLVYLWEFGDGTSGVGIAPQHLYDDPGLHEVTLTVIDRANQSESVTANVVGNPVSHYAPAVHLHPGEKYFPMDPGTFFAGSALWWNHDAACGNDKIATAKQVTAAKLKNGKWSHRATSFDRCRHTGKAYPSSALTAPARKGDSKKVSPGREGFYLNAPDKTWTGVRPSDSTYSNAPTLYYEHEPNKYVVYWLFYGLSGRVGDKHEATGNASWSVSTTVTSSPTVPTSSTIATRSTRLPASACVTTPNPCCPTTSLRTIHTSMCGQLSAVTRTSPRTSVRRRSRATTCARAPTTEPLTEASCGRRGRADSRTHATSPGTALESGGVTRSAQVSATVPWGQVVPWIGATAPQHLDLGCDNHRTRAHAADCRVVASGATPLADGIRLV